MKPSIEIQNQGKTKTFPPGITLTEILRQNHVTVDAADAVCGVTIGRATGKGSYHNHSSIGAGRLQDLEEVETQRKGLVRAVREWIPCVISLSGEQRQRGSVANGKPDEEEENELSVRQFVGQFGEEVANRS